ncbi:MAG: SLC13 family permease, partial [Nevskiales bacterium]
TNLLGLLLGFEVLARHFEQSEAPELLPRWLPDGFMGGFVLLSMVFVLSAFLDNIAAAMIGGTIAMHVYKGHVDIGFLAAIVAAANAGGAGSVLGDTTTTMMWIDGVAWTDVLHAFVAAVPALLFFGLVAAWQQHKVHPIRKDAPAGAQLRWERLAAVALILAGTILTNVLLDFPAVGVWIAILLCAPFMKTDWQVVPQSLKGSLFLVALVLCASLMPVEELPAASWQTAFGLGFLSAVFDNIPLTKLALDQGGYDWGMLAYAVGFGGSMIWFGSSAGVALANIFPRAKSVGGWLKRGWHVPVGYVLGFFILLWVLGWQPHERHRDVEAPSAMEQPAH